MAGMGARPKNAKGLWFADSPRARDDEVIQSGTLIAAMRISESALARRSA